MHPLISVMAGGAIGAAARYLAVTTLGVRSGWPLAARHLRSASSEDS